MRAMGAILLLLITSTALAQEWSGRVRGSWVRDGEAQPGDAVMADQKGVCDIVVGDDEHSAVKRAAAFLAGDIEKITGRKPAVVAKSVEGHHKIHLSTAANDQQAGKWPWRFAQGAWEAYQIRTMDGDVYLTGSNFRGTAFAAYTLSELPRALDDLRASRLSGAAVVRL